MSRKVVRNMITKVLRHNLNNRGLTLMEIMVAAGVMGIVALYVAHIISDMIVNKNTAEFFSVRHSIRSDLNNFLLKNNYGSKGKDSLYSDHLARPFQTVICLQKTSFYIEMLNHYCTRVRWILL